MTYSVVLHTYIHIIYISVCFWPFMDGKIHQNTVTTDWCTKDAMTELRLAANQRESWHPTRPGTGEKSLNLLGKIYTEPLFLISTKKVGSGRFSLKPGSFQKHERLSI